MFGMINVAGLVYRWMGPDNTDFAETAVTQTSVVVGASTTTYEFEVGDTSVLLTVKFTTPSVDLDNDEATFHDRPVTYVSFTVTSPVPVSVSIYMDTSAEGVVNNVANQVTWSRGNATTGLAADMMVGTTAQNFGSSTSDRINWGFSHLAVATPPDGGSVSSAMASGTVCRAAFNGGGVGLADVGDDATGPRACNDNWIVLAAQLDLSVGEALGSASGLVLLALDQGASSMRYFGQDLAPLWTTHSEEGTASAMLGKAALEASEVLAKAHDADALVVAEHSAAGGDKFATLTSLVWRQTTGALEKVWNPVTQEAWVFMKEISSDGDVSTIDVVYPASPFFLATASPETLRRLLLPLLAYANNETAAYGAPEFYDYAWAPHHLGVWPLCDLAASKQEQMPMEESGNLLLMIAGVAKLQGWNADSVSYLGPYWTLLNRYADYLVVSLPDPGNQLCTDDFEGASPHNTNLAAKGIVALAAWAEVLALQADNKYTEAAASYAKAAATFAGNWTAGALDASDPDHTKLQFDLEGSWSQKYNLLYQYVLDLEHKPFDDSVVALEETFYAGKINQFGVPLDDRADFTKLDWSMWCAAMGSEAQFQAITNATFAFADACTNRVPLSDWTETSTPTCQKGNTGFRARPVMGGIYAKLLLS